MKNKTVILLINYYKVLRINQWIKNLFIFIPVFFAGKIFSIENGVSLLLGFVSFSLVASSIYILNDYRDIASDKLHPVKRNRPLAAGTFSTSTAFILFLLCLSGGLLIAYSLKLVFFLVVVAYFILNICYCFGLKNISILDIIIIAIGFVLRIKGGGVLAQVEISSWLTIMVFLLALFLAITKRIDDIYLKQTSGIDLRKSIKGYNIELLNILLAVVASIIIMAYLMYTISPQVRLRLGTYRLYYTSVFVIAGLFRYLQITYINRNSDSPTKTLYKDLFIQVVLFLWVISFYIIIYLPSAKLFL